MKKTILLLAAGMSLGIMANVGMISSSAVKVTPIVAAETKTVKLQSGKYYGYDNGKLMKNRFTLVNGAYYYFKSDGSALVKSWKTINDSEYYFGSNGKAYIGAKKVGFKTIRIIREYGDHMGVKAKDSDVDKVIYSLKEIMIKEEMTK